MDPDDEGHSPNKGDAWVSSSFAHDGDHSWCGYLEGLGIDTMQICIVI